MLNVYIGQILSNLDRHLEVRLSVKEKIIALANLKDLQGEYSLNNKIIASVINIAREKDMGNTSEYLMQGNSYVEKKSALIFNIDILFANNFNAVQALDGLLYLSTIIGYFQANTSIPIDMYSGIQETVTARISTLDQQILDSIWQRLGVPYMTSVICNISTIPIKDETAKGVKIPRVEKVDIQHI
jgi:hypothetical protein